MSHFQSFFSDNEQPFDCYAVLALNESNFLVSTLICS